MLASQSNNLDEQYRKAAIFLCSLEEDAAARMLESMPTADAVAIRQAMDRLDEADLTEQDDVAAEFRREKLSVRPTANSGVELDASLLARIEQQEESTPQQQSVSPWESLTDEEAAKVVEVLSHEGPQTVAIVISRLKPQVAAVILPRLEEQLQEEVLCRLAELDPADESSVQVVEAHLGTWIYEHRQRKQRLAAGTELVQQILEQTEANDRQVIAGRIGRRNPRLASTLAIAAGSQVEPTPVPVAVSTSRPATSAKRFLPQTLPARVPEPKLAEIADPLGELNQLSDQALMSVLSSADRTVVTLALAGADESLMRRVLKSLPRNQAQQYRSQLRNIGPTRLSDMIDAQQRLAQFARQLGVQPVSK